MSSWLIIAAGLTAAAVLAAAVMQTTVSSLAEQVAVSAGTGASADPVGDQGAPGGPTAPSGLGTSQDGADLGALPTLESEGLTLTSRQKMIDGEEYLVLEVSDADGNVEELPPPIQLRSDDSDSDVSGGGAGDAQAATRPQDELDDYTIDDYVEDQAALGNEMSPQSIAAAQVELDLIQDTFADSDPDIRDRVLDDIRTRPGGMAPVAHIAGAGSEALPQDHYQDNLLGLIADTLFGWMRNRGRTPPPSLPIDRGVQQPSDSDYNPTRNDTDGDGIPNTIDRDFNPTPADTDGDGIPNTIDRDTEPADPFDLDLGDPDPIPAQPSVTTNPNRGGNNNTENDTDNQRGTTSNPGNPDNPAGEPDECNGSCA